MTEQRLERAAKRAKQDDVCTALNEHVLSPESTAELAQQFRDGKPYTHAVIKNVCDRKALEKARDELIHNVEAKFKETDLFKVCTRRAPDEPHCTVYELARARTSCADLARNVWTVQAGQLQMPEFTGLQAN